MKKLDELIKLLDVISTHSCFADEDTIEQVKTIYSLSCEAEKLALSLKKELTKGKNNGTK